MRSIAMSDCLGEFNGLQTPAMAMAMAVFQMNTMLWFDLLTMCSEGQKQKLQYSFQDQIEKRV